VQQSPIISVLHVRNDFIKQRVTVKSRDRMSALLASRENFYLHGEKGVRVESGDSSRSSVLLAWSVCLSLRDLMRVGATSSSVGRWAGVGWINAPLGLLGVDKRRIIAVILGGGESSVQV